MFFCPDLLKKRGRSLFTVWIASTQQGSCLKKFLPDRKLRGVNLDTVLQELMHIFVADIPRNIPVRLENFSLYLSAKLMYGTCVILQKQASFLIADLGEFLKNLKRLRWEEEEDECPEILRKFLFTRKELGKNKIDYDAADTEDISDFGQVDPLSFDGGDDQRFHSVPISCITMADEEFLQQITLVEDQRFGDEDTERHPAYLLPTEILYGPSHSAVDIRELSMLETEQTTATQAQGQTGQLILQDSLSIEAVLGKQKPLREAQELPDPQMVLGSLPMEVIPEEQERVLQTSAQVQEQPLGPDELRQPPIMLDSLPMEVVPEEQERVLQTSAQVQEQPLGPDELRQPPIMLDSLPMEVVPEEQERVLQTGVQVQEQPLGPDELRQSPIMEDLLPIEAVQEEQERLLQTSAQVQEQPLGPDELRQSPIMQDLLPIEAVQEEQEPLLQTAAQVQEQPLRPDELRQSPIMQDSLPIEAVQERQEPILQREEGMEALAGVQVAEPRVNRRRRYPFMDERIGIPGYEIRRRIDNGAQDTLRVETPSGERARICADWHCYDLTVMVRPGRRGPCSKSLRALFDRNLQIHAMPTVPDDLWMRPAPAEPAVHRSSDEMEEGQRAPELISSPTEHVTDRRASDASAGVTPLKRRSVDGEEGAIASKRSRLESESSISLQAAGIDSSNMRDRLPEGNTGLFESPPAGTGVSVDGPIESGDGLGSLYDPLEPAAPCFEIPRGEATLHASLQGPSAVETGTGAEYGSIDSSAIDPQLGITEREATLIQPLSTTAGAGDGRDAIHEPIEPTAPHFEIPRGEATLLASLQAPPAVEYGTGAEYGPIDSSAIDPQVGITEREATLIQPPSTTAGAGDGSVAMHEPIELTAPHFEITQSETRCFESPQKTTAGDSIGTGSHIFSPIPESPPIPTEVALDLIRELAEERNADTISMDVLCPPSSTRRSKAAKTLSTLLMLNKMKKVSLTQQLDGTTLGILQITQL